MRATKRARHRSESKPQADAIGVRLEHARTRAKMTARAAAGALGWSLQTLRNYETGVSSPNIKAILEMANIYSADAVELAFGPQAGHPSLRLVGSADGAPISIPASLVEGLPGPLESIEVIAPLRGIAIYRRGVWPDDHGGHAVLSSDRGAVIAWVWKDDGRWWAQTDPLTPRVPLRAGAMRGLLAVQMVRAIN